ncbi:uncharacterized protein LOC143146541 isoform X2 [Ptiloglossa arizonensis]|uniref:uncharacterized protein LOC143146541 isoform X2 n=1 Tax=Ptiloglossa arizonensis TaxID=3350558 RepID=UPI003FA173BE
MTRRRRAPLVLRVCIGIFLLLFSTVAADTIKGPPSIADKVLAPNNASETSTTEWNKTIPKKISSREDAEPALSENDKIRIDSSNATNDDRDTVHGKLIKDGQAEGEEKVATEIDKDTEVEGIRSRNEVDRLSTLDSTNGGSRFDEILYGSSGKSSSTKTVIEDVHRLSRTNDLTTATAKPTLEEPRYEERANETIPVEQGTIVNRYETNKTARTFENVTKSKEQLPIDTSEHTASKERKNPTSKPERSNFEGRSQKPNRPEEFQRAKKSENPLPTKNSEVPDLKRADEGNVDRGSISLINDTNVNYNHRQWTSTESLETGNQSTAFENATNFISEDGGSVARETGDPKEEVEVVGEVTDAVTQRVVEQRGQNSTKDVQVQEESGQGGHLDETAIRNATRTFQRIDEDDRSKEPTESFKEDPETFTVSSPVPRGRTIGFSDINEFPSLETKPTLPSRIDPPFAKKNVSAEKTIEQKIPYPYVKSLKEEFRSNGSRDDVTTEEASALENTIGRGQSEEKFIVTEASDVLENSIQQFKPAYHEKPTETESTVTPLRSSLPMTTVPLATPEEAEPTNRSVVDNEPKTLTLPDEKSANTGNELPRWSETREAITGKGNFDVTGNGITEVSLKSETTDKRTYEPPLPESVLGRTTISSLTTESTVKPQTEVGTFSNVDVQTNAASSMLIRSSLNVTEHSTQYPLIKENSSVTDEKSTIPIASPSEDTKMPESTTVLPIEDASTRNVEPRVTLNTNGTNEIPFDGVSSDPDKALPTTTGIEYEFVGLSETTPYLVENVTEEVPSGSLNATSTTVPTVQDLLPKNSSYEVSTVSATTITDNSSSLGETELPNLDDRIPSVSVPNLDDKSSSVPTTDRTIVPTSMTNPTAQTRDYFTTQPSLIDDERTDQTSAGDDDLPRTSSVTDSWTTISEDDIGVTTVGSEDSKDSRVALNVTQASVKSTLAPNVNATDDVQVATSNPFSTSNPRPRIPFSITIGTPSATDSPMETTADTKMSSSLEEITSLVRIVIEGSLHDVCSKIDQLRSNLAELLRTGMKRSVSDKQIIFHQDPCREPSGSTPSPSDMPLTPILVYVVDENEKFDSTMTNKLPSFYNEFRDRIKFPVTETIPDSGNAIAVVVVSSVAFICLVLLAGLLFIMRKRQTRFNYGERCRPVSLDAYSVDSVSAYNSVRRKGVARSSKRSYGNPTFEDSSAIPSHPLNFAGLSSFCNDTNAINEEFSGIPQVSAKIDELPVGAEVKNRYANVIPLPETRVPLQKMNNNPLTEYINASYVRGPKNAMRYYIACQAPMESTITDFWRMIWEQQCKVVIMLTDLVENGVEKCTEYIPPSEITDCHRLYGDYQVTLKKRETKEKYAISTLHLKNLENNTFREMYHIWYLWPVNGAQSDGAGLIAVLLEARALQRGGPGPIVVHCSPGTGRTGTLIALDLGIRQYEITRTVDVPRVVYTIRRDRAGAVQTKEQYAFIYKALNLYATKLAGGVLDST